MSRPFSYNDENFTVIGNILFVHFKITSEVPQGHNIIEIPQAIYERMYNKSSQVQLTSYKDDDYSTLWLDTAVRKSSVGKYYLYSPTKEIANIYIGFYLIAWYVLKDI